ncbi:sphingomyelin phosphodiesterase 2-like [Micropterus salmoides]|uniref:sphingomyelin phosphodiesterase 2-like n=1 Tax=Micropterus salmoides TaxID=27706 RepID=UPI0018EB583E|nr:sphingomyelin phosphodiesterase 2-like [Micropterus salmoides]XP_038551754.1 sphingomyelin phosphodiesterase 2-like [Micropterus salmoides]XP_038572971.1 sphingomyelin phosphodiesterase 2-like [Micropterus salmoides]XP_038572972.1 sphingomyelin phosphodiesterase 2-like [Micropterus salmoides]XP_045931407.1 sphingomyelin phosphodiesterase 2 [Micropterus dolomieu]XP_045931408.1 sphingomyelin phosphodiesterase 2 [Micropterus dolomieu]
MVNAESVSVRVFSLNCWGIHYISRHCSQRYAMIGEMLCKEEHDIVLLQEVWSEKDYLSLKKKLACSHPHSHYFKSGVIGSGLAIFSKHRIHDTFLYRYSVNGYPYMAHHGDWFGGKAVGMAVLNIGSLTANVYVTHLHAEYCRDKDPYLPHRVVQAWELQQFIRYTSTEADLVILGGDLNMHPQDLGNRLLRTYTGLRDSYLETAKFDGCEDGMTLIADNPFICKKELVPFEKGIRIDYILFKGSSKVDICCDFMSTTKGSVPDHPFPYSDHEALTTELRLETHTPTEARLDKQSKNQDSAAGEVAKLVDIVTEARTEVKVGLHCAERMRYTATRTGVMGLALLILELAIAAVPWLALGAEQPFPCTSFYLLAALCFAILLTTSLLYIFYTMELKSLQGAEDQMRLAVGSLQEKLRGFPLAQPHNPQRRPPEGQEPSAFGPK